MDLWVWDLDWALAGALGWNQDRVGQGSGSGFINKNWNLVDDVYDDSVVGLTTHPFFSALQYSTIQSRKTKPFFCFFFPFVSFFAVAYFSCGYNYFIYHHKHEYTKFTNGI